MMASRYINLIVLLVICTVFNSCNEEYPVYIKDGQNIAKLIKKDNSTAYVLDYSKELHDENKRWLVEDVAKYYNIEGLELKLYYNSDLEIVNSLGEDFLKAYHRYIIKPFDYRMTYVDEKGDSIAKLLWRHDGEGILLSSVLIDSSKLSSIISYLSLDYCTIYDHEIKEVGSKKNNLDYKGCYAIYNKGQWIYFDGSNEDYFKVGGINIWKIKESDMFVNYKTERKFSLDQILQSLEFMKFPSKIVYFYVDGEELDYASSVYIESSQYYNIGVFDENKTYTAIYNKKSLSWNTSVWQYSK